MGQGRSDTAALEFGEELRREDLMKPSNDEESLQTLLDLSAEHRLLVKTVKNEGWSELLDKLQGFRTRTPVSLPPAQGQGMRLFAEPWRAACGLIWDLEDLDLSDALMWPSGYFAKTEFNLNSDGTLAQGRTEALVTLEALRRDNDRREFIESLTGKVVTGCVLPYNEILAAVDGARGLVGVFARSSSVKHLLMAMGVRDWLAKRLPRLGKLPIMLHDPENGFRPFTFAAQVCLVRTCLDAGTTSHLRFPVDLRVLVAARDWAGAGISPVDWLRFHANYGITEESVKEVVDWARGDTAKSDCASPHGDAHDENRRKRGLTECAALALLALDFAVEADNADAATSVVRIVAPLVFEANSTCIPDGTCGGGSDSSSSSNDPRLVTIADPSMTLRALLSRARSQGVKVAVGACLALESFANGRSRQKVGSACVLLEEWLACAKKMSFRLQSLMDEKKSRCQRMPSATELGTFVSDRIISNRTLFLKTLKVLHHCPDRLDFFRHLQELALKLLNPCLRLHVLQGILGLDESYDRSTVVDVLNLAFELVFAMDASGDLGSQPAAWGRHSTC